MKWKAVIQSAILLTIASGSALLYPSADKASAAASAAPDQPKLNDKAASELRQLANGSGASFSVSWNEQTGTPALIQGHLTPVSRHTTEWIVAQFLERNKHLYGLKTPEINLKIREITALPGGKRIVRLAHYLFDTPVFGDYMKLTIDVQGVITTAESLIHPNLEKQLFNRPAHTVLSPKQAIRKSQSLLADGHAGRLQEPAAKLFYLPFRNGVPLVYEITYRYPNGLFAQRMWIHAVMGHSLDPAL